MEKHWMKFSLPSLSRKGKANETMNNKPSPENKWNCGKCDQKSANFPNGERIPEHSRHCTKQLAERSAAPTVICLSIDCPERTGGVCRDQSMVAPEEWRIELDVKFPYHPNEPLYGKENRKKRAHLKDFIAAEKEASRKQGCEGGKAFWEPSEYHKDIWRKEGYEEAKLHIVPCQWHQKDIEDRKAEERNRIKSDLLAIADQGEYEDLRREVEAYFEPDQKVADVETPESYAGE